MKKIIFGVLVTVLTATPCLAVKKRIQDCNKYSILDEPSGMMFEAGRVPSYQIQTQLAILEGGCRKEADPLIPGPIELLPLPKLLGADI